MAQGDGALYNEFKEELLPVSYTHLWVASDIGTGVKSSPDISAVLNEIVGAEGWAEGDDLALFLIDSGAGGNFVFAAYENATYPPAQLVVEWAFVTSIDVTVPLDTLSATGATVPLSVTPGAVSTLLDLSLIHI